MQKSIWALNYGNESQKRISNPKCVRCNFSNFSEGELCFRCMNNYNDTGNTIPSNENLPQPPRMQQTENSMPAYTMKQTSRLVSLGPMYGNEPTRIHQVNVDHNQGLATSRWAPRNTNGNIGPAEKRQVWTRIVNNSEPISYPTPSSMPKALDLGLPYQVQHYILVMIQRILEEGCFDFASRWIPGALRNNHWDCPEAVELATWKSFLPTALPANAVRPVCGHTLIAALADSVRIRNAATHRHLCDNTEVKRMALQAEMMMSMFADMTRRDKFRSLRIELDEWDLRSRVDPQGARHKLEAAMREISDLPVDDMDWTPNAVSLQEITDEGETAQEYVDEMELD